MAAPSLLRKLFPGIGIEGADPDPVKVDPNAPDPTKEPGKDPDTGKPTEPDPGPKDPLASFASIFDNKPAAKPGEEEDIPLSSAGILTAETLAKLTENLDFNTFLTQETRDLLAKGEDGNAIFTAFNEITKGAYQTALQHSSKLSEQILEDRLGRLEAGLGEKINAHQVNSTISANELINTSPVLKAGITMIAEKLRQAQPDADPKWITEQATSFFVESAKVLGGGEGSTPAPGEPGHVPVSGQETDWLGFAMGDTVNNPDGTEPTSGGDQGAQ